VNGLLPRRQRCSLRSDRPREGLGPPDQLVRETGSYGPPYPCERTPGVSGGSSCPLVIFPSVPTYQLKQPPPTTFKSRRQSHLQPTTAFDVTRGRGDWTPLELFLAGIRGWEAGLRRRIDDGKPSRHTNRVCFIRQGRADHGSRRGHRPVSSTRRHPIACERQPADRSPPPKTGPTTVPTFGWPHAVVR